MTDPPPLPPNALRFMNDRNDDQLFLRRGDHQIEMLRKNAKLNRYSSVLDVGSGYGRLAHALRRDPQFHGTYVGLDVLPKHVAWCQDALATPHFRFEYIDVANDRYNPNGREVASVRWPISNNSIDVINLASVFTHMWPQDVVHYFRLCRRVLRRGGRMFATFFLMNESWRELDRHGKARFELPYAHSKTCRYHSEKEPLHVVAYDQDWVLRTAKACGLVPLHVGLGSWAGRPSEHLQDVVVFRRRRRIASAWYVANHRLSRSPDRVIEAADTKTQSGLMGQPSATAQ